MNRHAPRSIVTWVALVVVALFVFGGAVALTTLGIGNGVPPTVPPSAPVAALSSTGSAAATSPSGAPGTPGPGVTPTPQPTPAPTDKVGPRHSVNPRDLTGYVWPLRNAWITSKFAPRAFGNFIVIDGVGYHDGLDLATHCGDTIRAAHDGRVLVADRTFDRYIGYQGHPEDIYNRTVRLGRPSALAIAVVIDDGNGYRSLYMHLKEATVEPGQLVHAGDPIGKEGETGAATGCHVHFSLIRMDGEWQQVLPRLHKYGYPLFIREHVDPLLVLPWGDQYAPQRLRDKVNPPSPSPSPSPPPTATPSPTPTASPSPAATNSASPPPS